MNNTETKPGVKTTEFWATVGVAGLPLADQLGFFDKMPVSEGGETALWLSAGIIVSSYVFTRAWVKIATLRYGVKNEEDTSKPIIRK